MCGPQHEARTCKVEKHLPYEGPAERLLFSHVAVRLGLEIQWWSHVSAPWQLSAAPAKGFSGTGASMPGPPLRPNAGRGDR